MGKHRTTEQKLKALRRRLARGKKIANRDIRHAFGEDGYGSYEAALAERKAAKAAYDKQMTERTDAQKKVVRAITSWLSITSRAGDGKARSKSADKWEERLGELFAELTHDERAQMNYWKMDEATGQIVAEYDATRELPIYKGYPSMGGVADLKRQALEQAIDGVLGKAQGTPIKNATLKARMTNLRKLTGD
jgi:hypothetical protein